MRVQPPLQQANTNTEQQPGWLPVTTAETFRVEMRFLPGCYGDGNRRDPARTGGTARSCVSPADQRGDDDAPGGAAAVGAGGLRVHVPVRGLVTLAPPAAQPEGVEEEEEEVQGQAQQRHGAEQQDGLWRHTHTHK